MARKHLIRKIRRKTGYIGLLTCSLIAKVTREKDIYLFAKFIAKIAYILARKQRRIAFESLRIAFANQKPQDEIRYIAESSFLHMAESGLELFYYVGHPQKMQNRVSFQGRHNLDEALSKGKGVIAITAHFGNFPLGQLFLAQQGYRVNSLIRHMRDPSADIYFLRKRDELGLKTIYTQPRRKCVYDSLRSLKNNEILFVMMDQNFGTGGIFVNFFGTKAATATGPVVLALRSKASLVPMFIIRNNDNTHKFIIEPELNIEEKDSYKDTIQFNIQKITDLFESYIRRYPSEWGWIHKRWKTRPK